jgi:hypothetical protein
LSDGSEEYTKINEKDQKLKAADVFAHDGTSIISSVLSGPDARTKITNETRTCLFMCYSFGLTDEEMRAHMEDILSYLRMLTRDSLETGDVTVVSA